MGMRTFATVVSTGSFTAAAERLGISKALTSKYVGLLEERLSVRLLNRTTRKLSVTESGQAYYLRCKQLIEDFDGLESAIKDHHSVPQGHLRVAAPTTFGEMYLTQAVADYLNLQTDVSVELALADRFVNIIDEGFDLAVRIGELVDSSLVARRFASTRIVTIASSDYLKKSGIPLFPEDLISHSCIVDTNLESKNYWSFQKGGQDYNVNVTGRFSVNNAYAVKEMVLAHHGIGLCPNYVIGEHFRNGSLKILLKEYMSHEYGIYAMYPHNRHLSSTTRSFVNFLVERFGRIKEW